MSKRKLSFFRRKMRRSYLEKGIILGMVEGKRRRGRPARVWVDDITELLGCTRAAAVQAAQDGTGWHRMVQGGGISSVPHLSSFGDYVTE